MGVIQQLINTNILLPLIMLVQRYSQVLGNSQGKLTANLAHIRGRLSALTEYSLRESGREQ